MELGRAYGLGRVALLAQSRLLLAAAELIASSMGLGFLLVNSPNNGRVDRMFLAIILLGVLGKTTDALIGLLERHSSGAGVRAPSWPCARCSPRHLSQTGGATADPTCDRHQGVSMKPRFR